MTVAIQKISVSYGGRAVLQDCTLDVSAGEILTLVGSSGCGKSTLLKVIAGVLPADMGSVLIGGRAVDDLPIRERSLAYVMDRLGLYPHKSVYGNIAYPLELRRVPASTVAARVAEICELLAITGLEQRRPDQLSAGQRQRVAIARALVRDDTVVLLADECFSNLDAQLRYRLRGDLRRWVKARKLTTIFVTHDQEEALALGDRVAFMNRGRIEQVAAPDEIYDKPDTLACATFFGVPPCNIISQHDGDAAPTILGALIAKGRSTIPDRAKLTFGFRPEAVRLSSSGAGAVEALVTALEPLKPNTVVHLELDGHRIRALSSSEPALKPGMKISFSVDPSAWLVFDGETGERLTWPR